MSSFTHVSQINALPSNSTIYYHNIHHESLNMYLRNVSHLRKLVGDDVLDEDWARLLQSFRRIRYDILRLPIPFNHPYLLQRVNLSFMTHLVSLSPFTRPSLASAAAQCLDSLNAVVSQSANPLYEEFAALGSIDEPEKSRALLLAHSRYVSQVIDSCHCENPQSLDIITQDALRRTDYWDEIIAIGSVSDFDDFVFSAPRARYIHIIGYTWYQTEWKSKSALLGGVAGKSSPRQYIVASSLSHIESLSSVNVDSLEELILSGTTAEEVSTGSDSLKIDARLYELFGGKGVFLEASDRKTVMIIDFDESAANRVRQVAETEVEEGMYVVLRTDNADGYIVPVANQLIGDDSTSYRNLQAAWKSQLGQIIESWGISRTVDLLLDQGSQRANHQNVQNWMSPNSIAPESDEDFLAIAQICGLEDRFDRMKLVAQTIRREHQRAGQKVRKLLRDLVQNVDADEIDRRGVEVFELPELPGAQLTAFRVEGKSTKRSSVASSAIERVFELNVL